MGTLASVAVAGAGLRLLLAARAADGPIVPSAVLVLGGVAAAAMGLAFTPFALAGVLPNVLGVVVLVLLVLALVNTLVAWAFLLRRMA